MENKSKMENKTTLQEITQAKSTVSTSCGSGHSAVLSEIFIFNHCKEAKA